MTIIPATPIPEAPVSQWIGFVGKSSPETIDFPMKIMGLKPVKFDVNPSVDIKTV